MTLKVTNIIMFLLLSLTAINLANCLQYYYNDSHLTSIMNEDLLLTTDNTIDRKVQCPFWFYFNRTTKQCECFTDPRTEEIVKCDGRVALQVQLRIGYCMTHDAQGKRIYVGHCYFKDSVEDYQVVSNNKNYIWLPNNISLLNDCMCGPLNRKGRLCSECIDEFGLSLNSVCSNCTQTWYGIPLFLFLEFVPITVFYIVILVFRVNVTSAPMVAFVYFSQLVFSFLLYYGNSLFLSKSNLVNNFLAALVFFYGFWNLDFFHGALPSFCISPRLNLMHITFMDYISAFYPILLIGVTWFFIALHSHGFKPIVWSWRKMTGCVRCRVLKDSCSKSLIDTFATFFLLSYAKIVFVTSRSLSPAKTIIVDNYSVDTRDFAEEYPAIEYFSEQHIPFAVTSIIIFLFAVMPLTLLLACYPMKSFRLLLFKCLSTRAIASVNIFVTKFYTCYRDGTGGGRDMRGMVSVYFVLRVFIAFFYTDIFFHFSTTIIVAVVLYGGCGLLIALVRPYKKNFMNVTDALIFANLALLNLLIGNWHHNLNQGKSSSYVTLFFLAILVSLPLVGLGGTVFYKIICSESVKRLMKKCLYFGKLYGSRIFSKPVNQEATAILNSCSTTRDDEIKLGDCASVSWSLDEMGREIQYIQHEEVSIDMSFD